MTPELWQRLKPLFHSALEKDAHEREAFIDSVCGVDSELKRHLLKLVEGADQSLTALDAPVATLSNQLPSEIFPGTILAQRYRVVALIGQGGMGQVYRAEDLKLNHTVALKFLSPDFTSNPGWVGRFLSEVRTAREVTHPNVCRVHDIVQTATHSGADLHFLTMEYVDGENLSKLLRRIGRLPTDTALKIAGQVAAGLVAAHSRGILHRDIKPANVLINGHGQAKLADFGLAILIESAGTAIPAGTPGYIAPEVLDGAVYNERSDLYSLGLVLFELFTGEIAPKDRTQQSMLLHKYASKVPETTLRTILQCLNTDPLERPSSAAEVLKTVPAEDPLDAALARGEIPSPAMVADAGSAVPLRLWKAWALIAVMSFSVAGLWLVAPRGNFLGAAPPQLSPTEMREKSREYLRNLGYVTDDISEVTVLNNNTALLDYLSFYGSPLQKGNIAHAAQGSLVLTYRQSKAQSLLPVRTRNGSAGSEDSSYASPIDPSPYLPGMTLIEVDSNGNLLRLIANPEGQSPSLPGEAASASDLATVPNWAGMIAAAGLDPTSLTEVLGPENSRTIPPFAFTDFRVWRGSYLGHPEIRITLEAAAWRGRLNWIEVNAPWDMVGHESGMPALTKLGIPLFILCSLLLAMLIARRNLQLGRGDLRSALRLAGLSVLLSLATTASGWHAGGGTVLDRIDWIFLEIESALTVGAAIWLAYIAIEPLARGRIPRLLVTSTQLLQGRWRSPAIGKEILIGSVLGVFGTLCFDWIHAYTWTRWPGASLSVAPAIFLAGGQHSLYAVMWRIGNLPVHVAQYAVLYVILRFVMRNNALANAIFFLCMLLVPGTHGSVLSALPVYAVIAGLATWIFARTGIVAAAAYLFTLSTIDRCVWPHRLGNWLVAPMVLSLSMIFILVAIGFSIAIGWQKAVGFFVNRRSV
jgi:serine/threonine protein kinase